MPKDELVNVIHNLQIKEMQQSFELRVDKL